MENFTCAHASRNSVTESYWSLMGVDAVNGIIAASFLLFFIVVGLPWNILVMVTIVKEKLYDQPSIILLLNLTTADIIFLLFPSPSLVVVGYAGEFILGSSDFIRCQMCPIAFLTLVLLFNSLFTITLMSVDRFLYIYKPLQYDRIVSIPIVLSWIVSIGIGIFPWLLPSQETTFQAIFLSCVLNAPMYYGIIQMVIGFAAVSVIVVSNVLIVRIVLKNLKLIYVKRCELGQLSNETWNEDRIKTRRAKQLHLFRLFGALLLSSILTWLPYVGVIAYLLILNYDGASHTVVSLCIIAFQSQPVVHPIVQTVFIADVRRPLMMIIKKIFLKNSQASSVGVDNASNATSKMKCCDKFLTALSEAVLPPQDSPHPPSN